MFLSRQIMSLLVAFASQNYGKLVAFYTIRCVCFSDFILSRLVIIIAWSFHPSIDIHVSGKQHIGRIPIQEKLQEIQSLKLRTILKFIILFYFFENALAACIVLMTNALKSNFETV